MPEDKVPASLYVLETDRLFLRQLTIGDAPFILELVNEPAFLQFIGDREVRTLKDARDYILNGPADSYDRYGFGLYWAGLKEDETPVGICGLVKREFLDDVDIGFAFLQRYWAKGYAFESASAVMVYARDILGLNRIVAITAPDNDRSMALLQKLDLEFEKMVSFPGEESEIKLFASNANF